MGILTRFVSMLSNMETLQPGPAMAAALPTPLYSVFLSELWLAPASHRSGGNEFHRVGTGTCISERSLNIASVSAVLVSFGVLAMVRMDSR